MRLFVAVRPSADALAHLARALGCAPSPRWHVTLAFLGEAADGGALASPLASVAAAAAPLQLQLAGGGRFGRAVWVGVHGDVAALSGLAGAVAAACGVADDRPYVPHLTVSRGGLDPASLAAYEGPPFLVDRLLLVESVLGRTAVHTVLQEHRLLG